jgi:hypothetical protein
MPGITYLGQVTIGKDFKIWHETSIADSLPVSLFIP